MSKQQKTYKLRDLLNTRYLTHNFVSDIDNLFSNIHSVSSGQTTFPHMPSELQTQLLKDVAEGYSITIDLAECIIYKDVAIALYSYKNLDINIINSLDDGWTSIQEENSFRYEEYKKQVESLPPLQYGQSFKDYLKQILPMNYYKPASIEPLSFATALLVWLYQPSIHLVLDTTIGPEYLKWINSYLNYKDFTNEKIFYGVFGNSIDICNVVDDYLVTRWGTAIELHRAFRDYSLVPYIFGRPLQEDELADPYLFPNIFNLSEYDALKEAVTQLYVEATQQKETTLYELVQEYYYEHE